MKREKKFYVIEFNSATNERAYVDWGGWATSIHDCETFDTRAQARKAIKRRWRSNRKLKAVDPKIVKFVRVD